MVKMNLDELVEYPVQVLQKVGTDKTIVSLLTNDPDIDMDSDEADEVFDKYLYDYGYVDETTQEAKAYICIEAEVSKVPTSTVKDMNLYVTVICHKDYMKIAPSLFPGTIGNRRDNLVRNIDRLLDGSDYFGIGQLRLKSVRTISSPTGFTAREATYVVSDFRGNQ